MLPWTELEIFGSKEAPFLVHGGCTFWTCFERRSLASRPQATGNRPQGTQKSNTHQRTQKSNTHHGDPPRRACSTEARRNVGEKKSKAKTKSKPENNRGHWG